MRVSTVFSTVFALAMPAQSVAQAMNRPQDMAGPQVYPMNTLPQARSMTCNSCGQWAMQGYTRSCDARDTMCRYSFSIVTPRDSPQPCVLQARGQGNRQASRSPITNVRCGRYTISSQWSNSFGSSGEGFTILVVVDYSRRLVAYPTFTDRQLGNGRSVRPDQSYLPQLLA